ncbi:MAG: Ig-like domain-containing protein, partial [Oscillospiraceae bacterium]|nr:Ig-like domain-containing protein [Oscillospiraceae bacterium]
DNCENNGSRDATQDIDPKTTTFTLTANALGTANITVTALLDGKPTTKVFTVNVLTELPKPIPVEMNFVFNAGAYGETEAIDRDGLEALDTAKTFATQGTNEWRMTSYYDMEANRKPQLGTDGLNWDFWRGRLTSTADPVAAIILKVTPGTYLPTVTYEALPTGYNAGIYLIPESKLKEPKTDGSSTHVPLDNSIEYKFGSNIQLHRYFENIAYYALTNAEEESYLVGEIDMYEQAQDIERESIDLDITDLEEETYYLFIKENGANPNMTVTPTAMFYSLKLTPADPADKPYLESVEIEFDKNPVPATRTAQATAVPMRNDGKKYTKTCEVVYASDNTEVAEIDAATGVISGIKPGFANITATVTPLEGGEPVSGTAQIEVGEAPKLASLRFTQDAVALLTGETEMSSSQVSVIAVMDDASEVSAEGYEVTYSSSDENVVTVDAETGIVTAVSEGKAEIIAEALNEKEESCSGSVPVTVYSELPSFSIDFKQTEVKEDYSLPDITPGYTILPDEGTLGTYVKNTVSDTGKKILFVNTYGKTNFWPNTNSKEQTFAFSVDVPISGYYSVRLLGAKYCKGAYYSIFAGNENIGFGFVGDHSFYDGLLETDPNSRTVMDKEHTLNTVYLSRGENKFYMRMRSRGSGNPYAIIDTLTFIPVMGDVGLSRLEADIPEALAVGETFDGSATAYMSDGSIRHFGDKNNDKTDATDKISASVDNDAVKVSGLDYVMGATENRNYTIEANAAGEATVTFSANIGDQVVKTTEKISVTVDPIVSTGAIMEAEEVFAGDSTRLIAQPKLQSGRVTASSAVSSVFTSEDESIASVDGNLLTAHKEGTTRIKVVSTFNNDTVEGYMDITVLPEGMTDIDATAGGSKHIRLTGVEGDVVPLYTTAISNIGRELDTEGAIVTAEALTPEYADITENLDIIPVSEGEARFLVTIELDGRIRSEEISLTVAKGKSSGSYMTPETVANVRENYKKYDWAETENAKTIARADQYVNELDKFYDMIHSNGIPRSIHFGRPGDPYVGCCRYCGTNLTDKYGMYTYGFSPLSRPWKLQCQDCKRLFPSNDFESFYKLGLNEYGEFDRIRALEANHRLVHHGSADAECDCTSPTDEWTMEWYNYYGYGDERGNLYNELYKEIEDVKTINNGAGLREGETVAGWGVDDSLGYIPRKPDGTPYTYSNGIVEAHLYIATYSHWGLWRRGTTGGGAVKDAIVDCANAYLYTGDVKYGRTAAILLDRYADFYPDHDLLVYGNTVYNSSGGDFNLGGTIGRIWETGNMEAFILAYDIVYDLYDDPYVLNYLKEKAKTIKFRYAKETPSQLRTHIEDGIVRDSLEGTVNRQVDGNFGMSQKVMALGGIVLDSAPETEYWLNFLMDSVWDAESTVSMQKGGGIESRIVDMVDADGQGDESSEYNEGWVSALVNVEKYLRVREDMSLANYPKFIRMLYSCVWLMTPYYTPHIGDSQTTLAKTHWLNEAELLTGWMCTKDPLFAQGLYLLNGNTVEDLHYDITEKNPERLQDEVQAVIDEHGTFNLDSQMLTNFGFAMLRDGADYSAATQSTATTTSRGAWMYFGSNGGHGHRDTLNLGFMAYGLEFLPDLAYPSETGYQPNRLQWIRSTLSHNTVMVDEIEQTVVEEIHGKAKHFDDDGIVQLVDVSTPYVYASTDEYRRSVVQIKVDDEISYLVDFFRVLGGNDHVYSMHVTSNEVAETSGLDFTLVEDENGNYISGSQLDENGNYKGTYAGRDATYIKNTVTEAVRLPVEGGVLGENEVELPVEYGKDPNSPAKWTYTTLYPRGYTWLRNVDRDTSPEGKAEIDFVIKDFNKWLKDSSGLRMRMTILNGSNMKDGVASDISIADGIPPLVAQNKNIDKLKYVLVKNTGENLDTTFTTVFEPYRTTRYLRSSDELEMRVVDGTEAQEDAYRAVRVEHTNGRVDYILYATNRNVTYEITLDDGKALRFRGFVGVYTVKDGENTYKYLHDGDILGEATGDTGVINGTVKDFTRDISLENEIIITTEKALSDEAIGDLAGRYVFIDNGAQTRSGSFEIKGASRSSEDDKEVTLDVGQVTPIRSFVDGYDHSKGFVYMIAEGQTLRIPTTYSEDFAPEFAPVSSNLTTSAGRSISVTVAATSPKDIGITYEAEMLPRGASLNAETGVVTWKPTASQVGDNHFAITAIDELGRESTVHFYVTVYGSTTGSSSSSDKTEENSGTSSEGAGAAGGGGGGGAAPDDKLDDETKTDETDDESLPLEEKVPSEGEADEVEKTQFTDTANHAWAEDAINTLAADGIIKGTTASAFSPANNITRADFALLLVRAFKLESENAENFADVAASDYFAAELAIARNNGIISGIGDN